MQIFSIIVLQHILITSTFIFNSKDIYGNSLLVYSHPDSIKKFSNRELETLNSHNLFTRPLSTLVFNILTKNKPIYVRT